MARVSGQVLSPFVRQKRSLTLRVREEGKEKLLELPAGAVTLLVEILEAMAAGRGVTLIPESAELTTMQAADVLNVSRPFLIKLLEENVLPHRKVGKHRRIRMEDVMAYKAATDREREARRCSTNLRVKRRNKGWATIGDEPVHGSSRCERAVCGAAEGCVFATGGDGHFRSEVVGGHSSGVDGRVLAAPHPSQDWLRVCLCPSR